MLFKDLSIIAFCESIEDFRMDRKKKYLLEEILFLSLSAILSGCESWYNIADFGEEKLDWLRKYYPYESGIPSHDTISRVFSYLDDRQFEESLINWLSEGWELPTGLIINIDGKALRKSVSKRAMQLPHDQGGKHAVHIVHAWVEEFSICIGQYKTDGKCNEIDAIDELLDLLSIQGSIVTIDAVGCQKKFAKKIVEDKKADYLLAVKRNQPTLHTGIVNAFANFEKTAEKEEKCFAQYDVNQSFGHGRIEQRTCRVLPANELPTDIQMLWVGLNSIIEICSTRTVDSTGKTSNETRYYIASIPAKEFNANNLVRKHWGVENGMHWSLDVVFNEDQSRKQHQNSAQNYGLLLRIALSLIKNHPAKISMNRKKLKCALSDKFREEVICETF